MSPATLLPLLAIALLAYFLWQATKPSWPVRIVVEGSYVRELHGVAQAHQGDIREFFQHDVQVDGTLIVHARRERDGYLRTEILGEASPGTRQQIRNFLVVTL